jgi:AcrR family transcriptional regulator
MVRTDQVGQGQALATSRGGKMKERKTTSLHELFAQNAERILEQLLAVLLETESTVYKQMPTEVLRTRVQRLFDAFWQGISQNDPKPMIDYIWATGRERGNEGFTVADLQVVALCLRDILLEMVDEAYANDPERRLHNSRRTEELILTGISAGVRGFVDGREALIARQYQALRRSQKAAGDKGEKSQ